jgi:hypothetical protein
MRETGLRKSHWTTLGILGGDKAEFESDIEAKRRTISIRTNFAVLKSGHSVSIRSESRRRRIRKPPTVTRPSPIIT